MEISHHEARRGWERPITTQRITTKPLSGLRSFLVRRAEVSCSGVRFRVLRNLDGEVRGD